MSTAFQVIQQRITNLLSNVTDLSIFREWLELQSSSDLLKWTEFMVRLEQSVTTQFNQTIQQKLKEKIPFFRPENNPTIFEDLENPEKSTKLVAGHVQSGKTAVICGLAIYMVKALGIPTVVVVRNYTADYQQLARKFRSNGNFGDIDLLVHYAKDARRNQMFSNDYPALIVCLEHQTQLRKVIESYQLRRIPFCLIADEADSVCYKAKIEKERIGLFNSLRDLSSQFIAVTATAFDMLYIDSKLENKNIYHVPVPENYKGIDHPDFSIEELKRGFDFKLENETPSIWKLSTDIEQFYTQIANTPVFVNEEEKEIHPVICLQKTETEIKKQLQCMGALIRHPVFGREFAVMAYNGEGVTVYTPNRLDTEIADVEGDMCKGESHSSTYLEGLPVLHYKSLGVGDVLQYFKTRPEPVSHIVIIAGQMVGRGLNICSSDYKWHLTHQILRVSDTATCSDITQSCRVFGVYSDAIPTRLYVLQKDAMSLKQSHYLQKRIYEGASVHELSENMPNLCAQIKMFVGHIPRRRTTKKCEEPHWNKVAKEREQYEDLLEEEKNDSDEEWGLKHMLKNIKARLREERDTIIIRILRFMTENNNPQEQSVIQDKCGCQNWASYIKWDKNHNRYKLLVQTPEYLWKINPVVFEEIKNNASLYDKIFK